MRLDENVELGKCLDSSRGSRAVARWISHCCCTTRAVKTTALTERKPPPTPKFQPKVIRDSNPNFRIDPDPDVCRICPKTWTHYLVGVSHFAKYGTNRPLIV